MPRPPTLGFPPWQLGSFVRRHESTRFASFGSLLQFGHIALGSSESLGLLRGRVAGDQVRPQPAAWQVVKVKIDALAVIVEADLGAAALRDDLVPDQPDICYAPMIPPIGPGGKPLLVGEWLLGRIYSLCAGTHAAPADTPELMSCAEFFS
jgi:hypothetical protein